jgi:hypothetical protein
MNAASQFPISSIGRPVAFEEHEVEIEGMRVLFDKRVTLFPVMLDELATAIKRQKRNA